MNKIKNKGMTIIVTSIIVFSIAIIVLDTSLSITGLSTQSIKDPGNGLYVINNFLMIILTITGIYELTKQKRRMIK